MYLRNLNCLCKRIGIRTNNILNRSYNDKSIKEDDSDLGSLKSKYKTFKENEAEIVLDIHENHLNYPNSKFINNVEPTEIKERLTRGVHGVFDIEDLIDVLQEENAQDIFVSTVPPKLNYVDYIVAVNGKSKRHMLAIAEFVRKMYKSKRYSNEILPKIEGKNSNEWIALDLGNIALHIFSKNARKLYDIDSLWAVGHEYDAESNKPLDAITEMLESNVDFLQKLETK